MNGDHAAMWIGGLQRIADLDEFLLDVRLGARPCTDLAVPLARDEKISIEGAIAGRDIAGVPLAGARIGKSSPGEWLHLALVSPSQHDAADEVSSIRVRQPQ